MNNVLLLLSYIIAGNQDIVEISQDNSRVIIMAQRDAIVEFLGPMSQNNGFKRESLNINKIDKVLIAGSFIISTKSGVKLVVRDGGIYINSKRLNDDIISINERGSVSPFRLTNR